MLDIKSPNIFSENHVEQHDERIKTDATQQIEKLQKTIGNSSNNQILSTLHFYDIIQTFCIKNNLPYKRELSLILTPILYAASISINDDSQITLLKNDIYAVLSILLRKFVPFLYTNNYDSLL